MKKALVIEDDPDIASLVAINLRDIDCQAEIVTNGLDGLARALDNCHDVIILDIMLPRLDGLEICRRLRQAQVSTPVLMLTSRTEEIEKVLALNLGADDYITKPFGVNELLARVKARLRRYSPEEAPFVGEASRVVRGGLMLDVARHRVSLDRRDIELTVKEFELLNLFMRHPGRIYKRGDLLDLVWGYSFQGYAHTVNSHINRLRMKIEQDSGHPQYILTVWGIGYKFNDQLD